MKILNFIKMFARHRSLIVIACLLAGLALISICGLAALNDIKSASQAESKPVLTEERGK